METEPTLKQCTQESFEFEGHFSLPVAAGLDGGSVTSGGGAWLRSRPQASG
jgi:hypothetical protein